MNKYIVMAGIVLTCVLVGCGRSRYRNFYSLSDASGQAVSGGRAGGAEMQEGSNSLGQEVSGSALEEGVHAVGDVTAKMQEADFWIAKTTAADRILMSDEEIKEYNGTLKKQLSSSPGAIYYDLSAYGDTIEGDALRQMVGQQDDFAGTFYAGEEEVTEEQWSTIRENCQEEQMQGTLPIRYGVVVCRADVRALPTARNITDAKGDLGHDVLQCTALAVNEPVLIMCASRDQKWFYVVANEYAGWVMQDRIAMCRSRDDWEKAQEMENFIVVTGDEITVDIPEEEAKQIFTMGTRLCLAEESEYRVSLGKKCIYDNYVVKIPARREDGELEYQYVLIPLGKDVSCGYLEYTRANVLRQSFKLLGNPYRWGGMQGGRDCSSMTRDVFLCFGFRLPRNADIQGKLSGKGVIRLGGKSGQERLAELRSVLPGTILQMPGHVMIYLGCVEQKLYVISANGCLIPSAGQQAENSDDSSFQTRLVTVNDLDVKSPSNGKTWMEQLTTVIGIP